MALAPVATRLRPDTIARVDMLLPRLAARMPGAADFTRSDAIRAAVERGVEALEAELTPLPPPVEPAKKGGKPARTPASKPK